MSEEAWREALAAYIEAQALPREKFGHQPRLHALTRTIGAGLHYDDDVVFAAAWLHDLGVFTGHRPEEPEALARWDSVAYALAAAPELLASMHFPPEKIGAVQEAIATHQPQYDPQSLEATILRDADILEQLGAVGVLRTVCKVGRDTRFPDFTQAVASLTRAVSTLPPLLRLPSAQALGRERAATLQSFLAAVADEAGDALL